MQIKSTSASLQNLFAMKYLEKAIQFKISQFDLTLIPLAITFHKTQAQSYALQLCKGPQIFKQFTEHIWVHAGENSYRFQDTESATFKLQNEKSLACDWSLYKITDDDQRDFIGSITIDLTHALGHYLQDIKKYSKDYSKLIGNYQLGQEITKEWKTIKEQIKDECEMEGGSKQLGVDLRCRFRVNCEIDRLVEEECARAREKIIDKMMSKNSGQSSLKSLGDESQSANTYHVLQSSSAQYPVPHVLQSPPLQYLVPEINIEQVAFSITKPQPVMKKETLSDIVQASVSNEYSSNRNFGDKASKRPEGINQAVNEIPEEYEPPSPFRVSTRSQNFDKLDIKQDIDSLFKLKIRSNTSQQNFSRENEINPSLFCTTGNTSHQALREHYLNEREQQQGKSQLQQGIQTAPQSFLRPQEPQTENLPLNSEIQEPSSQQDSSKPLSSFKIIFVTLVMLILALGSFYQLTGFAEFRQSASRAVGGGYQKTSDKEPKSKRNQKNSKKNQRQSKREEKPAKQNQQKEKKESQRNAKKEDENSAKSKPKKVQTSQKAFKSKEKAKK